MWIWSYYCWGQCQSSGSVRLLPGCPRLRYSVTDGLSYFRLALLFYQLPKRFLDYAKGLCTLGTPARHMRRGCKAMQLGFSRIPQIPVLLWSFFSWSSYPCSFHHDFPFSCLSIFSKYRIHANTEASNRSIRDVGSIFSYCIMSSVFSTALTFWTQYS